MWHRFGKRDWRLSQIALRKPRKRRQCPGFRNTIRGKNLPIPKRHLKGNTLCIIAGSPAWDLHSRPANPASRCAANREKYVQILQCGDYAPILRFYFIPIKSKCQWQMCTNTTLFYGSFHQSPGIFWFFLFDSQIPASFAGWETRPLHFSCRGGVAPTK